LLRGAPITTHADAGNSSYFYTASPDATYGWMGSACTVKAAYICEVPADSFPCP
jgi:hypothetical protein